MVSQVMIVWFWPCNKFDSLKKRQYVCFDWLKNAAQYSNQLLESSTAANANVVLTINRMLLLLHKL